MADKIIDAIREDFANDSVCCYHIAFEIEDSGNKNAFVITIKAEDMDDSTDKAEAKTLATAIATTMKAAWVATFPDAHSNNAEPTLEGAVTL